MIIYGKEIARAMQQEVKETIEQLTGRKPCLAVILVGNDPASEIYVNRKAEACQEVGITSIKKHFPETLTEKELLSEIHTLNTDPHIDGILVQLPLPKQIDASQVMLAIDPAKDVDGFHPTNVGKLLIGEKDGFFPCTPLGVFKIFEHYQIPLKDQNILVIGRSNIVGKPLAAMLMQYAIGPTAAVTVAHRSTPNLKQYTLAADLIIVAVGIPNFITEEMVKKGVTIIDIGINKVEDSTRKRGYRVVGDTDFEQVKEKCAYITPVPGGVGPVTISTLLTNTLQSYMRWVKQ